MPFPAQLGAERVMRWMPGLAAIAAALLLSGCVPTAVVPSSKPTDAEVELWATKQDGWLWDSTALDDSLRPASIEHQFVDTEEWIRALSSCMADRGYARYDLSAVPQLLYVFDPVDEPQERLDWYECQAVYQVDPREYDLLGGAMLDYLHRYNTRVLVPCLEVHGVHVEYVPTRDEAAFGGEFSGWNPYNWMRQSFDPATSAKDRLVFESCPVYPQASYFDEMRRLW